MATLYTNKKILHFFEPKQIACVNKPSVSFKESINITLIENGPDDLIQFENIHNICPNGKRFYRYYTNIIRNGILNYK